MGISLPLNSLGVGADVCSWNARALHHHIKAVRDRKVTEVWKLCKEFSIIGIVEAHGCPISLSVSLARCLRSHVLFCSHVLDTNGKVLNNLGGICVLVAKTYFAPPLASVISFQVLSAGRAVQVGVRSAEGHKQFDVFLSTILVLTLLAPLP
jgi:hypothetical protein